MIAKKIKHPIVGQIPADCCPTPDIELLSQTYCGAGGPTRFRLACRSCGCGKPDPGIIGVIGYWVHSRETLEDTLPAIREVWKKTLEQWKETREAKQVEDELLHRIELEKHAREWPPTL